ncbi:MAG: AprI/Inh family metalloprotease inhibitor [Pseudolabrys sp.]|nr:AprI/Inh family metalloprotease inhibitor [Pseudolabrys sp.]
MRRKARLLLAAVLAASLTGPAAAYDFEPIKPIDVKEVEPAMLADIYGVWEIRDKGGKKRCRITLLKDFGIGGMQIEVAPGCDKAFPVMGDISAWRLLEGWAIEFADPLRKTRVRWTTPDNRYVAFGDDKDIAGMDNLVKVEAKAVPRKK